MCVPGCSPRDEQGEAAKKASPKDCKRSDSECPDKVKPKLVRLIVIENATQTDVTGAKNWAAVKKSSDDVIVEATTSPNNDESEWTQINWSGDTGTEVAGHRNRRKLSRATSKKHHVEAELGGESDHVDVWILWATATILTSGTTPANSAQFGLIRDGTENLGAKSYNGGNSAAGKIVAVGTITPPGVHDVVKAGWDLRRERISHDWNDGAKVREGNTESDYWNTAWVDDTSYARYKKLTPDNDDKIYDIDAPNVANVGGDNYETYNNFRQWVEWNSEACSDKAGWYWKGRWDKTTAPQVTLKDVGTGNIALPDDPHFPP